MDKYNKIVQKWQNFVTFLILTLELGESIAEQIKTCPSGQVLKLWLRGMDLLRHLGSFALLTAILPSGSRLRLNHAFSVVQTHATGKNKNVPLRPHFYFNWLRGMDLNHRPSGYEPDELPDCSTPR